MDGLAIIEYGLKGILLLMDLGFLMCFVIFQIAAWAEFLSNRKAVSEGKNKIESFTWFFFIASIFSELMSIVLSGAIVTGWWV